MRRCVLHTLLLFAILSASASLVSASETLRGPWVKPAALPTDSDQTVEFSLNTGEIGRVDIERHSRFLDGLELEIEIPEAVQPYIGSFALHVIAAAKTTQDGEHARVQGERVLFETLPRGRRVFVLLPMHPEHGMRASADSLQVSRRLTTDDLPVALSIRPVMKGLPEGVRQARFPVKLRTVFREEGAAQVVLVGPDGEKLDEQEHYITEILDEIELSIGEQRISNLAEELVLPAGLHRVQLTSERYVDRSETFGLERGRVQTVHLTLEEETSTIFVDAPLGVEMFLNGERVERLDQELTVTPGTYTVLFRFGEYTISRSLTVEPQQDYKVSLSLDILIDED